MAEFITSYPEKSRKKWIITGGAGLIGCHAAAGHVSSSWTTSAVRGPPRTSPGCAGRGSLDFVWADVRDAQAMHDLLAQHAEADMPGHMNHGG